MLDQGLVMEIVVLADLAIFTGVNGPEDNGPRAGCAAAGFVRAISAGVSIGWGQFRMEMGVV